MSLSLPSSYFVADDARPPGRGRSARPASPASAKRMRYWLTARGIVPSSRAIDRVDWPSAARFAPATRAAVPSSLRAAELPASPDPPVSIDPAQDLLVRQALARLSC
jgi:hypothetical protein